MGQPRTNLKDAPKEMKIRTFFEKHISLNTFRKIHDGISFICLLPFEKHWPQWDWNFDTNLRPLAPKDFFDRLGYFLGLQGRWFWRGFQRIVSSDSSLVSTSASFYRSFCFTGFESCLRSEVEFKNWLEFAGNPMYRSECLSG